MKEIDRDRLNEMLGEVFPDIRCSFTDDDGCVHTALPDFLDLGTLLKAVMEKYDPPNYCFEFGSYPGRYKYGCRILRANEDGFFAGTRTRTQRHPDPSIAIAKAVLAAEGLKMPHNETADAR